MKKKIIKRVLLGLLVIVVLIQFIRPEKNQGSADTDKDITHFVHVPDTIRSLLKKSCYDCHSNHTNYPWYADISPGSLWLASHIRNGKDKLNFSDFAQYTTRRKKNKLTSIVEQIEEREMPLKSYLFLHRNARLSPGQIQLIIDWADSAKTQLEGK